MHCKDGIADCEQDYNKALKFFKRSAKVGHMDAQCRLAYCYVVGRGVRKDGAKALALWVTAATEGSADGQ